MCTPDIMDIVYKMIKQKTKNIYDNYLLSYVTYIIFRNEPFQADDRHMNNTIYDVAGTALTTS